MIPYSGVYFEDLSNIELNENVLNFDGTINICRLVGLQRVIDKLLNCQIISYPICPVS